MIIVEQIKLAPGHTDFDLKKKVCRVLGIKNTEKCPEFEIMKRSVDARKKPDIFFVYSVRITDGAFEVPKGADRRRIKTAEEENYDFAVMSGLQGKMSYTGAENKSAKVPEAGLFTKTSGSYTADKNNRPKARPVIIGFGPAGMFCALMLAKAGFRPIVLERGKCAGDRIKDVDRFFETGKPDENSNVQFGEGGAGTFSDGKLNNGTGSGGGRAREVLNTFVRHGAPENILYESKPHIGTDILVNVIQGIRGEIEGLGGEVRFNARFEVFLRDNAGNVRACAYKDLRTGKMEEIPADGICLAIGHSARDTFEQIYGAGVPREQKAFAVGVRIEHPQEIIDRYAYGEDFAALRKNKALPAADYKLTAHTKEGRGVYSFCMCPGGFVVNSSSEEGMICVNGMSYHARDGRNANSALVVTVSGEDFGPGVLDGMEFQRKLEKAAFIEGKGQVPVQLWGDFVINKESKGCGNVIPSIKGSFAFSNLRRVLPDFISLSLLECMEDFGRRIPGFDMDGACLSGVESRTSSPVRIPRDDTGMSEVKGLFPCGEGAGYAGGIMSAAVDGIKCAEKMARYIL